MAWAGRKNARCFSELNNSNASTRRERERESSRFAVIVAAPARTGKLEGESCWKKIFNIKEKR